MTRRGWAAACLFLSACASTDSRSRETPRPEPITTEEMLRLGRAGISEDLIVARIERQGVARRPSADDLVSLKREGWSDRAIEAALTAPVVEAPRRATPYPRPTHGPSSSPVGPWICDPGAWARWRFHWQGW